jgi:uncharacterized protein YbjT (DUF2867 family)
VDLGAAVKLMEAARAEGIRRYVMVSAIGSGRPERWSEAMRPYYEAKTEADERLAAAGLDHTIVRPGGLTDGPGSGRVRVGADLGSGRVARADVAEVLAAALATDATVGKAFDVLEGDTPVDAALRSL